MAKHTVNSSYMEEGHENNTVHVRNGYNAVELMLRRGEEDEQ